MARRISGPYSPGAVLDRIAGIPRPPQPPRRPGAGIGAAMLFFAPLPFALRAPFLDPVGMVFSLLALAMLLLGAWLTREGVIAQKEYDARPVARRPAIPRKIFAAIATALGLGLGTYSADAASGALLYALAGGALHLAAFGLDPLRDKGASAGDVAQTERIARTIAEAETRLAEIAAAIAPLRDRALQDRVQRFDQSARAMFRRVEEDPRDLTAVRRYLGVYLQGARDATVKYAALQAHGPNPAARAEYEALLGDLEANFAARAQRLLQNDETDLTIEIDVLRDRLRREGLIEGTSRRSTG
ncbi:5-bromo-4-chloroindolyl phosphate hydrolysis family protein [Plastorhodobacter daqingensis]|uniref:5-bromo-4-chloroindolyl phosphate hydrolysis family protein n=1 Tax=Plastorhodobacter daqingensis TaxID=1387281 RepID=A0ABW2UKL8_9RHOB